MGFWSISTMNTAYIFSEDTAALVKLLPPMLNHCWVSVGPSLSLPPSLPPSLCHSLPPSFHPSLSPSLPLTPYLLSHYPLILSLPPPSSLLPNTAHSSWYCGPLRTTSCSSSLPITPCCPDNHTPVQLCIHYRVGNPSIKY